jgi:hypothetical protein
VLLDWTADSRTQTVPALRAVLMDYSQLAPLLASADGQREPPRLGQPARQVADIFDAYQHSRFGYVTAHAPGLPRDTVVAARNAEGDAVIRALDIGPALDTSALPTERRVRHLLEVARAYSARNRREEGLAIVLDAERMAPEQVRHHYISRQLVLTWMRQQRTKPSLELAGLASRLRLT